MRILLVEDEAPLRETLAARLKREGFAVDAASDGEEGRYMGREVPFDMAIIDLGLPKLSGMDLVRDLREQQKKFPILILTARASWQDKVEGLKAGTDMLCLITETDTTFKLKAKADTVRGVRIGKQSRFLRHFTAEFRWA